MSQSNCVLQAKLNYLKISSIELMCALIDLMRALKQFRRNIDLINFELGVNDLMISLNHLKISLIILPCPRIGFNTRINSIEARIQSIKEINNLHCGYVELKISLIQLKRAIIELMCRSIQSLLS
jgi:hypothetical protein